MSTTGIRRALEYMRGMVLTGDQSKARIAALAEVERVEAAIASAREEGRREGFERAREMRGGESQTPAQGCAELCDFEPCRKAGRCDG